MTNSPLYENRNEASAPDLQEHWQEALGAIMEYAEAKAEKDLRQKIERECLSRLFSSLKDLEQLRIKCPRYHKVIVVILRNYPCSYSVAARELSISRAAVQQAIRGAARHIPWISCIMQARDIYTRQQENGPG